MKSAAGPWTLINGQDGAPTNPRFRGWRRAHVGTEWPAGTVSTGGGQPGCGNRAWSGMACGIGDRPGLFLSSWDPGDVGPVEPEAETLAQAMDRIDRALLAAGWTLQSGGDAPCLRCGGFGATEGDEPCGNCHGDGADRHGGES